MMEELRAKFVGGPRDRKTRSLRGKLPKVITCQEDCKFHNVKGHYLRRGENAFGVTLYDWVPANPLQSIAQQDLDTGFVQALKDGELRQ